MTVVIRRILPVSLALFGAYAAFSQVSHAAPQPGQTAQPGTIVEHVPCSKHPDQSYALYLPSNYSPTHSWPVVYSFDPAARGEVPVELQRQAAERYGYILAASNNSRNGAWKDELEAALAMTEDTEARFSVDTRRVYFTGFSGGARLASQLASLCKCAAGVLLSGAGFATGREPAREVTFPVFSAVGALDFNYREVILLQAKLAQAGYPHWLRIFDGQHQWAPAEVMEEAFTWFRVQAMKSNLESRNDAFLQDQFAKTEARANSFLQSHDVLNAYREYAQAAVTYDGLIDTTAVRAKAHALSEEKPLHDATKREKNEFAEQEQISSAISVALSADLGPAPSDSASTSSADDQIILLRERAEREQRQERARILKRALSEVFLEALELGAHSMEQQDFKSAVREFRSATKANPQSEWAWESLAVAEARAGARKEMVAALQRANDLCSDKSGFSKWLNHEPAFDRYRSSPEFQNLQRTD